jgi:DNA excision repair protein ERCC-2
MRPQKGRLVCIRCSARGRGQAQAALGPTPAPGAFDPPIAPVASAWRPTRAGSPHPQLGLFPYDQIRDGQRRLARDVATAVASGRHLVAQAPTGIGKTAATLAPAIEHAMATRKTVLFLTSRQSQHRIAVDTVRLIGERRGAAIALVDLVAKRDMCLRAEARDMHPARFPDFCSSETRNKTCSFIREVDAGTLRAVRTGVLHVEELMHESRAAHLCPHLVALQAARDAHVVVADYNHLFSDIREQSLARLGLRLEDVIVIVDEAHNLPDRIRGSHSHRITPFLLAQVASEARSQKAKDVEFDVDALSAALARLASQAEAAGTAQARFGGGEAKVAPVEAHRLGEVFGEERARGRLGPQRGLAEAAGALAALAAKLRKGTDAVVHAEQLQEALEDWGRFGPGALRFVEWDGGAASLHVRLLDPGIPARLVFAGVHAAILASGTLRPPEMVRDLLGLEPGRTTVRSYPSPFPPENRLAVVAQGVTTRYQDRGPAMWRRVAAILAGTAAATRGNLAAFAPSYAILRDVRDALDEAGVAKELVVEDPDWTKADRDRVLDTLQGARARRGGALLLGVLGGSLAEGIDYRDNLLSAVAVVGLPLAPPDLEVEAACAYLEGRFAGRGRAYGSTYPAMNKVLQALGRPIRSASDKCVVLLLDERFLGPPYRALLPDDLPVVATPDPVAAVTPFLARHGL